MSDMTEGMLGIFPPLIVGGALMMFTDRFISKPVRTTRRKAKRFDEQEYRDLRQKRRGLEFGNFSNIGW